MTAEDNLIRILTVENRRLNTESINPIQTLITKAETILLREPSLLRIEPPIIAVGDIHGQFEDLLWIFQQTGFPPATSYIFLGDYVDRGRHSVECISLLLSLKVKYPKNVYLLRGNHECTMINHKYGFYNECRQRFNVGLWNKFSGLFDCLPLAAIIGSKIFCCHGGLSPDLKTVDQIESIRRPFPINTLTGLVNDLLWSDPSRFHKGWKYNKYRSVSYTFGSDVIEKFLSDNNFQLIVRAHQLISSGYQIFAGGKLISIFSAPNYCSNHMNEGALLHIDANLKCSIIRLKYDFVVPTTAAHF
ncbi:uncharacterized protein LOC135843197 isoform X2 [Planococcus citri]|uniref:uncharacterized protein LOC135843197 isoform X2 n=1 Tax=Planococcus citri TaxID=170843 RepID=UPI0031F8A5B0